MAYSSLEAHIAVMNEITKQDGQKENGLTTPQTDAQLTYNKTEPNGSGLSKTHQTQLQLSPGDDNDNTDNS